MKTNELIAALSQDASSSQPRHPISWPVLAIAALSLCAVLMFSIFPVRPDLASVLSYYGFLIKPLVAALLAVPAFRLVMEISYPSGQPRRLLPWLGLGVVVLFIGVGIEMMVVPPADWAGRLIGRNPVACGVSVFLLGLPILAMMIWAVRQRATVRPVLAGLFAGLFSGAVSTFLYAAHCQEDSSFFLATWYGLAIGGQAVIGAIAGRLLLRW